MWPSGSRRRTCRAQDERSEDIGSALHPALKFGPHGHRRSALNPGRRPGIRTVTRCRSMKWNAPAPGDRRGGNDGIQGPVAHFCPTLADHGEPRRTACRAIRGAADRHGRPRRGMFRKRHRPWRRGAWRRSARPGGFVRDPCRRALRGRRARPTRRTPPVFEMSAGHVGRQPRRGVRPRGAAARRPRPAAHGARCRRTRAASVPVPASRRRGQPVPGGRERPGS